MAGPCCLVIFGASGDLAKRKLLPSLYRLFHQWVASGPVLSSWNGQGSHRARSATQVMLDAVREALPGSIDADRWNDFSARLYYSTLNYRDAATYARRPA